MGTSVLLPSVRSKSNSGCSTSDTCGVVQEVWKASLVAAQPRAKLWLNVKLRLRPRTQRLGTMHIAAPPGYRQRVAQTASASQLHVVTKQPTAPSLPGRLPPLGCGTAAGEA